MDIIFTPLISVIMPAYNAEKYIKDAIKSIMNQTYTYWELLIMDDGSIDKTLAIAKEFECENIKVYSNKNAGQSSQLNYGISQAKGIYIAIAHADDINHPERFSGQVNFLDQNKHIDFCGTFANILFNNDFEIRKYSITPTDCFTSLFYANPIIHPTVMMRKAILEKLPYIYNERYNAAEDYDLWVRLSDFSQMANIDNALIHYRIHGASNSILRKGEEQILEKRIRLNLVKQLLKTEKRNTQVMGYNFFYRYNKISFLSIWRVLFYIKKSFKAKNNLDIDVLNTFLKKRFIVLLKQKPYHLRLMHAPLSPILFIAFRGNNAFNVVKTLYFSKSSCI